MVNAIPYRLGLDLGTSSLGWAAVRLDQPDGEPQSILAAGVRIFEAGVEGDIEQGKDASRAVVRRQARQPRRQQWRRQHRKRKLFALLQKHGLLPASEGIDSASRKKTLDALDEQLAQKFVPSDDHDAHQKLPYQLRDRAAHEPVEAFELGRALYHLAQRRGYLSNRKGKSNEEETGQVLSAISEMDKHLKEEKLPLGAYLNRKTKFRKNPTAQDERIRRRWLGRQQYRDEFETIRKAQADAHPQLTDEAWKQIETAIFYQRPLKSQSHLIGRCELEFNKRGKGLKRCPIALPIAQEFRILQKVNDLRVTTPTRVNDSLSDAERRKLIDALNESEELTWAKVKKLLGFKNKETKFSLEEWDPKLIGNRTNAKMLTVFGQRWFEFTPEEREAITLEVLHYRKPEALKKRAMTAWGLDEAAAHELAYKVHLEQDYANLSKRAMQKLIDGKPGVEGLRQGASYSTIRKALYPDQCKAGQSLPSLPPVNDWKADIRNPAVIRALTELRKVVNGVIRKYGKPEHIHIELARDLRNSRKKRKEIHDQNQKNRKRREAAVAAIIKEAKLANPKRRDIEKWLLAEECNFECPYCGEAINRKKLMGDDASFNVEHIYPRRYLDDSFLNKTIACRKCNDLKGDRTPEQAFHGDRLVEILQRVERFKGDARDIKLARFKSTPDVNEFVERQMNDTRYNSRIAAEYLQLLYGGRSDASGEQRIITPSGALVGRVRANWQLNDLLGEEDGEKERQDHRHHAIDAIVIALMTQKQIQGLSELASRAEEHRTRHFFDSIQYPWPNFKNTVAYAIEEINVSHRPTRTIAGPLHAETIYSRNFGTEKKPEYRVRKHLSKLSTTEISGDQIVDPRVREAVQKKWEELGKANPSKLWGSDDADFPVLKSKEGTGPGSVIRKVRIRSNVNPRKVGKNVRQRNYASGKDSNYASMIYAILDDAGNEIKWEHEIIDRLTAHQILSANHSNSGEKVLIPNETEKRKLKFALRKNDMLLAQGPDGEEVLYRVQAFSNDEIQLCENSVPNIRGVQRNPWNRIKAIDNLRKRGARLVGISPIGEVVEFEKKE